MVNDCDTCKHKDKNWDDLPCDGCCTAHSGYEAGMNREQAINYLRSSGFSEEQINTVVDALSEPKWISVKDRLPELHKWVLCACRANIYEVLYLDKDGWHSDTAYAFYMKSFVLAWMPLPEPYKVEPQESDHKCHTCKHYTSGELDGSCDSYICKHYSDWESEEQE